MLTDDRAEKFAQKKGQQTPAQPTGQGQSQGTQAASNQGTGQSK